MINQFKTFVLLALLTGMLLFVGQLLGGAFGLGLAIVIVVGMNFVSYFWSDKIVLKMYKAKHVTLNSYPELYGMVKEVAQQAKIPMPKVYIIPSSQANAFATGRNPKNASVACTEGILSLLTKNELKGVLAHEISHIKNRDILIQTVAATIAGIIGFVASMARWSAIFGGFGGDDDGGGLIGLLVLAIVAPLMAVVIQLAISRSREYLADETGARIIHDPKSLASALEKIHDSAKKNPMRFGSPSSSSLFIANPFKASGIVNLLSTHPPVQQRVDRLNKLRLH
ncbi:MAG: zinc metalloprotease HtpX [Candidatus Nanoarchaeia archaeon]